MSSYSCLLDCFAYASEIPQEDLIKNLGHDGSSIIYPNLPEPFCRRGFNVFELMDMYLNVYGKRTTFLVKEVACQNAFTTQPLIVNNDITSKHLLRGLTCIAMNTSHAVVCDGRSIIYNPAEKDCFVFVPLTFEQILRDHIALIIF